MASMSVNFHGETEAAPYTAEAKQHQSFCSIDIRSTSSQFVTLYFGPIVPFKHVEAIATAINAATAPPAIPDEEPTDAQP